MTSAEAIWWLLAIATFGVGDTFTTVAGTRWAGLVERSPIVRRVAGRQPSIPALVGLKLVAFLVAGGLGRLLPPGSYRSMVPASIAAVGLLATGFNVWVIVTHGDTVDLALPGTGRLKRSGDTGPDDAE